MNKVPFLFCFTLLLFLEDFLAKGDDNLSTLALRNEDDVFLPDVEGNSGTETSAEGDTANENGDNTKGEELVASEQNYISNNLVLQAIQDAKDEEKIKKVDGKKENSTHQVVVMPGLPGLPGMPGLPGKAELLRSKSVKSPEFSNCRFNVSGDGRFLCNYTDIIDSSQPMGSNTFPFVSEPKEKATGSWNDFLRLALRNKHYRGDHNHNRVPENFHHQNLTNPEIGRDDHNYHKRPLPLHHQSQSNSLNDHHENETLMETSGHDEDLVPVTVIEEPNGTLILIETDDYQTPPAPVGPDSQTMFQKMSMSFDVDSYNYPYFPPWFPIGIPSIHSVSVYGTPGSPGAPGMPGTPGVAVIYGNPLKYSSIHSSGSEPIISAITRPRPRPTITRSPGYTPPYYPILGEEQYGVPGVQSSSIFYGGVPGSLTSSQATAGIDSFPEPFIPMVPPGRPGTSVNYERYPVNYQAGYPPYSYPYPYPSGYQTQQRPYPYYPGYPGYPNPLGYTFSTKLN